MGGELHDQFLVDAIQGGAGTSTNMNANEVIANRGLEILGHKRGDYRHLHPNNDVNLSQSTNDVYPTSLRLAVLLSYGSLSSSMDEICYQLKLKSVEFANIVKMGRTQLQDAVPITLGQEFGAFYATLKKDIQALDIVVDRFREVNLGATAVGTGINTDPEYASLAIEELCQISGERLIPSRNLMEATSDLGDFVSLSGVLKRHAIKLSKICNDLRLMSSGPRAGLSEINLPPVQPGSSIMPGKVNPVIPELVNQVAFEVIGSDLVVSMAAEAGQLQLNVMEPIVIFNILRSIKFLRNANHALAVKCISGISANRARCLENVENSIGIVTALNPHLGYETACSIAKEAIETSASIIEIVKRRNLLSDAQLEDILRPENMVQPRRLRPTTAN